MVGPEPDWFQRLKEAMGNYKPPKPNPYGLGQGYVYEDKPTIDPSGNTTQITQLSSNIQQRIDTSPQTGLQRRIRKTYWERPWPYYNYIGIGEIQGEIVDPWKRLRLQVHGRGSSYYNKYHIPDITLEMGTTDAAVALHTLEIKYRGYGGSNVREFTYEKHTDNKIRIGDGVFPDWNAAHDYIYSRGLDTNIKEACGLLRSLGERVLDPDVDLDELGDEGNDYQEYGAFMGVKNALERAEEDVPDDQEIVYANWSDEKIEAFIGGMKARTQRLLFPYLMTTDVNYSVGEINQAVKRIALEAAPLYAREMGELANATDEQNDKMFRLCVNQALSTILFNHYRKVQQLDQFEVNYEELRDENFDPNGQFSLTFSTYGGMSSKKIAQEVVKAGERYTFDGTDYIVDQEGQDLLFIARDCLQPARGFHATFRARDINMKRMLRAAQTYEASGWERALGYFPANIQG